MRGLCHSCNASNVDIMIVCGITKCRNCGNKDPLPKRIN